MVKIPKSVKTIVLGALFLFFMCLVLLHFIKWVNTEGMDDMPVDTSANIVSDPVVINDAILGDASSVTIARIDASGVPVVVKKAIDVSANPIVSE